MCEEFEVGFAEKELLRCHDEAIRLAEVWM